MARKQQEQVIDQQPRFVAGDQVEISTQTGWTAATVIEAVRNAFGWLYIVRYVPSWNTTGGCTAVTGRAVR